MPTKIEYGYNKLLSSYDDISRIAEDCVISRYLNCSSGKQKIQYFTACPNFLTFADYLESLNSQ